MPKLGQLEPPPQLLGHPGLVGDLGLGLHAVEVVAHHHSPSLPGLEAPAVIVKVQEVSQQLEPEVAVPTEYSTSPMIRNYYLNVRENKILKTHFIWKTSFNFLSISFSTSDIVTSRKQSYL